MTYHQLFDPSGSGCAVVATMAKSGTVPDPDTHFEYRVWGEYPKARKLLAKMATDVTREQYDDCYLLVDDMAWNAKVRDRSMKVKQLVAEKRGFECWTSDWYKEADGVPAPFDDLFTELRLDRKAKGKSFDLSKAAAKLEDDVARVVFVSKDRRRYRIGGLRAEVTDIEIDGADEALRSLAIEGSDLDALVALRKELGLKNVPNMAMHVAISEQEQTL